MELSAVIVVTALLGLIFVAILRITNKRAACTACTNNLGRLAQASSLYAKDNRDYLALPNWGNGPQRGWLYSSTNSVPPDPGPGGAYAGNQIAAYKTGLWFQYIRDPRNYLCPLDAQSAGYRGRVDGMEVRVKAFVKNPRKGFPVAARVITRQQRLSSYLMNGAVCGFVETNPPARISAVWNSRCFLLWEPEDSSHGTIFSGFFYNDGAVYPDHGEGLGDVHRQRGGFIVTVGGSLSFSSCSNFQTEAEAKGKSLAWWSPFSDDGH